MKTHVKLTALFWYEEHILTYQNMKSRLKLTSHISWKNNQKNKNTKTQTKTHQQKQNKNTINKKSTTNMKPVSSQSIKYVLTHSRIFLLSETFNKWENSIGHTEKLSLNQDDQNRHSLLVPLKKLAQAMATITTSTFKHTNMANYRRTPTQKFLKFRGEKWRITCPTTLTTLQSSWSLNSVSSSDEHSSHQHWLTVLTPLLFKDFMKTLKIFCSEFKTQKIKIILISQLKQHIRLRCCFNFPKATERKKSILQLS